MHRIIGIDPGLGGAIAVLDIGTGGMVDLFDMPTLKAKTKRSIDEIELARRLDGWAHEAACACIEAVNVRPGEGAVGAFTFGHGVGVLRGILRAHFIPIIDVGPVSWKRAMGIKAGAGKDASLAVAKELFQPNAALLARKKDDGRAEALLIAEYGRRLHLKKAA